MRNVAACLKHLFLFLFIMSCGSPGNNYSYVPVDTYKDMHQLEMKSPDGMPPASLSEALKIMQSAKIENRDLKVFVAMHDVENDWSRRVLEGIKDYLTFYDISLFAVTDAGFDVNKQLADYKVIADLDVDVLITLPLDNGLAEAPLKVLADQGIKLVFLDTVPESISRETAFSGWTVGDGYSLGYLGAEILEAEIGNGSVALLHWSNDMYTVSQRSKGAVDFIRQSSFISLGAELYFTEFHEIENIIFELLEKQPDIKGIWTVWDTPALEVYNALLKKGRHDILVTTVDLSSDLAEIMTAGKNVIGTATDHPYDEGVAAGVLALAACNQIEVPGFIVIPAEKVTVDNFHKAWKRVYGFDYSEGNR